MYLILTENIELVKLAEKHQEQVFDLGTSQPPFLSIINGIHKKDYFQDPQKHIEQVLFKLLTTVGIPAHLKGFKYISYGVTLLLNDDSYENFGITKRLYPEIAKHFKTLPSRIERDIRNAIKFSFKNGPHDLIQDILGISKGKATNSEFLIGIKNYLQIMYNL